ncbi:MAG TPA: LuxR C-terminal-related transcriptional regulator [Jatrophihabitans sp.]|nr:LuxR C-terminal-related transcriptional regulator [Jatrophihabitans sp.]
MANNLPLTATTFVGRAELSAAMHSRLASAPLVTLTGPGGAGKTRLALEFARNALADFAGGVWLIDLAPVESADEVIAAVGAPLGVTAPGSGAPPLLVEQVAERRMLLVLDNCEHVLEPVAALVRRLVESCPQLRIVCTSREPLGLISEAIIAVGPLPDPADAVALFVDRARAVDPGFDPASDDDAVLAEICARLDNLPLAIELAAPWVRVAAPADLLPIVGRFDVVAGTRRDLPARQRTMRATVEWSHGLLSGDEQVLWRRLAVFRGTFDLPAVSAVCGGPALRPTVPADAVEPLVAQLVQRSMLAVERRATSAVRYRLLETMRDLATDRLAGCGEAEAVHDRHFAHYLAAAEQIDTARRRSGSDADTDRLVPDADNYRAALAWGLVRDPRGALRLATALEPFWMIRSVSEGREWLLRALDRVPEPTLARARALVVPPLVVAGGLAWPRARGMIESAIEIFTLHGDETGAALAQLTLALSAFFHGELAEALRVVEEVRRDGSASGVGSHALIRSRSAVYRAGIVSFRPRQLLDGVAELSAALDVARDAGDSWGTGLALMLLGLAEIRAHRAEAARGHLDAALRSRMQAGVTASAIGGCGQLVLDTDPRRALVLLDAAVALRERSGVPRFPVPVQAQLAPVRAAAARRLAPAVVQRCREQARALTTEEAVALARTPPPAANGLTARQQEIALLAAGGLTNRMIAQQLGVSVRTVETHVNAVLHTLRLRSRTQLADWAREAQLIT